MKHKIKHKTDKKILKYKGICDSKMTFEECELSILRSAIDKAENIIGRKTANSPEIKIIISIVENFIKKNQLICYGGTAINNILPKQDQFYDKDIEIPDYDFYSFNALNDAKELVDIYIDNNFTEVEAKAGQHHGTYKVYVNFIPVADITYMPKELFNAVKKQSIRVAGILYAPANFLRMGMYLELSRPAGDVSRWEKVLKRLTLLNKNYPLIGKDCDKVNFQRKMNENKNSEEIYEIVQKSLMDQGVVFFGGFALSLYSQYMPYQIKQQLNKIPDFDVLSEEPLLTAQIIQERLKDINIKNVKIIKRPGIGEIVAPNYEIKINKDTIGFIYEPLACHSYNMIKYKGYDIKIATIDTMLSFYLAFLFANRPYYDTTRILCMSNFLFEVQEKNRLEQRGLLKRFSLNCMGHQETIEEMRAEKSKKHLELKKSDPEYEEWFLRYRPLDNKDTNKDNKDTNKTKRIKTKSKKQKTKKRKSLFSF